MPLSQLVKRRFAKLADGEASSSATATLSGFCWNPGDSGRKIRKAAIFPWKN